MEKKKITGAGSDDSGGWYMAVFDGPNLARERTIAGLGYFSIAGLGYFSLSLSP